MVEVLPRIFLGGFMESAGEFVHTNEIKTIVTVMDFALQPNEQNVVYKYFKMYDMPQENIRQYFEEMVDVISESIQKGNVLVHCQVGMSRSVTAIISYMVGALGIGVDESLKIIREKRPWACPNNGFMDQLKSFEIDVKCDKFDSSKYATTADFHFDLIKRRKLQDENSHRMAEQELQKRIQLRKGQSSDIPGKPNVCTFKCKKCRKVLFSSLDLELHQKCMSVAVNYGPKGIDANRKECTSYFLDSDSDLSWLPKAEGVVGGKINCDKCSAKIGHFSWTATQCSCGVWITPAFQVHKSKVDKVQPVNINS